MKGQIMKWDALATDFDGTLAVDGKVSAANTAALIRLHELGAALILVSGRSVKQLHSLGYDLRIFRLIVAEDGCILYDPAQEKAEALAAPLDESLLKSLNATGITPLKIGECAVCTQRANEEVVRWLCDRHPQYHLLLDKGSLSILPKDINKQTGLGAALKRLQIDSSRVLGVGDAENDIALLACCGGKVAVNDALPEVKACADFVTKENAAGSMPEVVALFQGFNT